MEVGVITNSGSDITQEEAKQLGITVIPVYLHFGDEVERKKGGQIAKVATARKLLEWIYHILRDSKTYQEMEKIADLLGRGELGNCPGQ